MLWQLAPDLAFEARPAIQKKAPPADGASLRVGGNMTDWRIVTSPKRLGAAAAKFLTPMAISSDPSVRKKSHAKGGRHGTGAGGGL